MAVRVLKCVKPFYHQELRRPIREGMIVRSDDPAVKSHEQFFVDVLEDLGVEQATKNPGQKRAAKKPKGKKPTSVSAEPAEVTTEKKSSDG